MASASGSSHYFAYQVEDTAGTLPSPFTPTELRILEGSDFSDDRSALVSSELTSDRQIKSSVLGTPSPSFNPSVEYSFGSFDDLIAGALQNTWVGATYASGITVDVAATTLTTDDGTTWDTYGAVDGEVITVTGFTVTGDSGSFLVVSGSSTDTITLQTLSAGTPALTVEADATLTVIGGRNSVVIDVSSNNVTVDATAGTLTAASAIWTSSAPDLKYNDLIYLKFDDSASSTSGYYKVSSVTSTVLTVSDTTGLTSETLSTNNLEVGNNSSMIVTGSTKKNFSIESGYTDVEQYRYMTGAQVSAMDMSFSTDSIVSGSFTFMGRYLSAFSTASQATSVGDASTTSVFNTFRGFISFDGSAPSCLTDFSLSLDNNSEALQCLFEEELDDIVHGRSNVTGSFTAYFDDPTLSNAYSDEDYINIFITMEDADGNSISVGVPNAQLQGDSFDISETTVSESLNWQSLGVDTTYTNIYFINSREIPA